MIASQQNVDNALEITPSTTAGGSTFSTPALTILSNRNVGIGTTSPAYKLHVEGSGTANEIVGWFNNQGAFSSSIAVRNANKTAYLTNNQGLSTPNYTGQLSSALALGVGAGVSPIQFYNGSPATAKMTILESGNVGIGTTSPQSILEVLTSSSTTNAIVSTILVNAKTTGTFAAGFGPAIKFHGSMTGQDNVELGLIGAVNVNGTGAFGELVFYTRPNGPSVERMRITNGGNTQPGTDNAYSLGASGIRWSAVWAATGTIQTSDEREKKDIVDSDLGLDFINKLRPVSFKWKVGQNVVTSETIINENGEEESKQVITPREGIRTHYGLIAQEVETLLDGKDFGGFIHDTETDIKGLRYDQFVPLLIKSIQEQNQLIQEQKQLITNMESRLKALEKN
jgi:hypothetical protein